MYIKYIFDQTNITHMCIYVIYLCDILYIYINTFVCDILCTCVCVSFIQFSNSLIKSNLLPSVVRGAKGFVGTGSTDRMR